MKTIEYEGTQHQFPDDFSDADIAKALGGKPAAPAAEPENALTRGYRQYVAEPFTKGATHALQFLPGMSGFSNLGAAGALGESGMQADEAIRGGAAKMIVPQTPTDLALMVGTGGAGRVAAGARPLVQAGARVAGGLLGNEVGNALEDKPLGTNAVRTGGTLGSMEAAIPALGIIRRSMPGAKAAINEMQASHLADTLGIISPDLAAMLPKATARVAAGTTGRTAAGVQELALGELGQDALSGRAEQMVQKIEQALPNFSVKSRSLQQAYGMMPPLIQDQVGPVAQNGFTLRQAQKVKGWIGSKAFADSQLGQGVDPASKQILEGQVAGDIQSALLNQGWDARRGVQATAEGMGRQQLALPPASSGGVRPPGRFEQGPMPEAGAVIHPEPRGLIPMRSGPQDTLGEAAALMRGEPKPYTPMGVAPAENNIVIETTGNTARELPITGPGRHPTMQRVGRLPQPEPPVAPNLGPPPKGALDPLMDWQLGNREYAGGQAMLEGLRGGNVFPGGQNSIALNRNALSDFLSKNRAELRQRMGPEQFDAVVNAVLEGGQVGTKDILAPGAGGPLDALRQVYGRGQGGAPQIVGSLLRTGLPNIGSQYTGRAPFTASQGTQTLADLAALRAAGVLSPGSHP